MDIAMYDKRFTITFRLAKRKFFVVNYGDVKSNEFPYFSTSTEELNFRRSDYACCGQGQEDMLTKSFQKARDFWLKWDKKHLSKLTNAEYQELMEDLEVLKEQYHHIDGNSFYKVVDFDRSFK